jgi:DNA-binding protein H-NS
MLKLIAIAWVQNSYEKANLPELSPEAQGLFIHRRVRQYPLDSELWPLHEERKTMALKTMPIAKLQQLKSQVEATISAKVTERRRELETELSKLGGISGGGKATRFARGGRMGPVAPKYRNPENPAETWAGRGLKPRWLAAAIKGGKKQDDFLIPGADKGSAAKPTRKTRKMGTV